MAHRSSGLDGSRSVIAHSPDAAEPDSSRPARVTRIDSFSRVLNHSPVYSCCRQ